MNQILLALVKFLKHSHVFCCIRIRYLDFLGCHFINSSADNKSLRFIILFECEDKFQMVFHFNLINFQTLVSLINLSLLPSLIDG